MKSTVKAMLMLLTVVLIAGCSQKSKLKDIVEEENAKCPYLLEDGVTVSEVELSGTTVAFFISLDDTYSYLLDDDSGKEVLRDGLLHWFTDGDSPFKEVVEAVINESGTISCGFQDEEGAKWKCKFKSDELASARIENADITDDNDNDEANELFDEDYDDAEAVDFESLASSTDIDISSMDGHTKETVLRLGIEEAGKQMPVDIDDGLTIESVKLVDRNVVYTIGVDEDEMDMEMLQTAEDEVKELMLDKLLEDEESKYVCRLLVETNRGLDYKYVGNTSGRSVNIHITSSELKRVLGR